MFAELRNEQAQLEKRLDVCLRRREDLHTLPLPKEDFIKSVESLIEKADSGYPSDLKHTLESLVKSPAERPNWPKFNPLTTFLSTPSPSALLFIFRKQIAAGVREALTTWDWPDKVGPPQAERFKELEKLDKEIADLQQQLETIKRAARGDV